MERQGTAPLGYSTAQLSGRLCLSLGLALATIPLLMALFAGSVKAAYTPATPIPAFGKVTSVAVNQDNRELYAASPVGPKGFAHADNFFAPELPGAVQRFDSSGAGLPFDGTPPSPIGVTIDPTDGQVYVVDYTNPTLSPTPMLRTFTAAGTEVGTPFSLVASSPAGQPAADSDGNIYYPNTVADRIDVFQPNGTPIALDNPIVGIENPTSVAFDASGEIYVSEPARAGVNEKQKVEFEEFADADTFTLANLPPACASSVTAAIDWHINPTTLNNRILAALNAACGTTGDFAVAGIPPEVGFQGQFAGTDVPLLSCVPGETEGDCSTETTQESVPPFPGQVLKFAADGAPQGTFANAGNTVAVNKSSGDVFVGIGRGAAFHIEQRSPAGALLDDFGAGEFSSDGATLPQNHLAVDETSGTVYAADYGANEVEVFTSGAPTPQHDLDVSVTGNGKVDEDPAGQIADCRADGGDCEGTYDDGTEVLLKATADSGHELEAWGGACAGTDVSEDCEVTMDGNKSAGATFVAEATGGPYTPATPIPAFGKVTSVAVNQDSRELYAASPVGPGGFGIPSISPPNLPGKVERFDSSGSPLAFSGTPPSPVGVTIDPTDDEVYVVDYANPINFPDPTTPMLRTFGAAGTEVGTPFSLAISKPLGQPAADSDGNIYYPNTVADRIDVFEPNGTPIALANPIVGIENPTSVAFDASGEIYVSEPARAGINEKQKVEFEEFVDADTFTLANLPPACASSATAAIDWHINPTTLNNRIDAALEAACTPPSGPPPPGDFAVTGIPPEVGFQGQFAGTDVPLLSCVPGVTEGDCSTETTQESVPPFPGQVLKFAADGEPQGTFANAGNTVAVNKSSGDVFVGIGRGADFHIEQRSPAGALLDDFGAGEFSSNVSANAPGAQNHLAVDETSGTVYAADYGADQVEVFTSGAPPVQHPLTVVKAGDGEGTVSSAPAGIDCGPECDEQTAQFNEEAEVTLTAEAETPGSTFAGWGDGECDSEPSANECVVTMGEGRSVTATFDEVVIDEFDLTVSVSGEGKVDESPAGQIADCRSDSGSCLGTYVENDEVLLKATADPGHEFVAWTGCDSEPDGDCKVTMDADRSVSATFAPIPPAEFDLTVSVSGEGKVDANVGAIAGCRESSGDCLGSYDPGTVVTLTATADPGHKLHEWGGACGGTGACVVTMSSAKSVTATFVAKPFYQLEVSIFGGGAGTVTSSPGGINCGTGSCSAQFMEGTTVTLTATPAAGSTFSHWSGACSGAGACQVTLSEARALSATFDAIPPVVPPPPPPPPPPPAPLAFVAPNIVVKGGQALVRISCRKASADRCRGAFRLIAKLRVGKGNRARNRNVVIGRTSFNLAPGTSRVLKVRIRNRQAKQLLRKGRVLRASIKGNGVRNRNVRLRQPGGRR